MDNIQFRTLVLDKQVTYLAKCILAELDSLSFLAIEKILTFGERSLTARFDQQRLSKHRYRRELDIFRSFVHQERNRPESKPSENYYSLRLGCPPEILDSWEAFKPYRDKRISELEAQVELRPYLIVDSQEINSTGAYRNFCIMLMSTFLLEKDEEKYSYLKDTNDLLRISYILSGNDMLKVATPKIRKKDLTKEELLRLKQTTVQDTITKQENKDNEQVSEIFDL